MNDLRRDRSDQWLEKLLGRTHETVRAPRGFARRVMDVVYKESLAAERRSSEAAPRGSGLYRRLGWSFMLTAVVLAMSLLILHGGYTTLIGADSAGAALGTGPSDAVRGALTIAGQAVQGALGQNQIGGSNE